MDDKVHQLNIKPATHRFHHEGFVVVVTYDPETKGWTWVATKPVQSKIEWTGQATTANRALDQARRRIDRNV
jgi:hypothetical protein